MAPVSYTHLDFKKGENVGGLQKEAYKGRRTGSIIHWKPDDEVFTDIDVPGSYYKDTLRRQAVVNAGQMCIRDSWVAMCTMCAAAVCWNWRTKNTCALAVRKARMWRIGNPA